MSNWDDAVKILCFYDPRHSIVSRTEPTTSSQTHKKLHMKYMPNNQLVIDPPFQHVITNRTICNNVYAELDNIRGMT